MTKAIRSPIRHSLISACLLVTLTTVGCAPDLRTQQINEIFAGSDKAAILELVASGEHDKRVGQGDESVTDRWWYPIHIAAFENNSVALQLMLEAGVDPNRQDVDGATPLIRLFGGKDRDTRANVDLLVKAGADVNLTDNTQTTALHKAAIHGRHEYFTTLVDAGAHIDAKDRFGNTPLHLAASAIGGVTPMTIETLIELGADKSAVNDAGSTALQLCRENTRCRCEELLKSDF